MILEPELECMPRAVLARLQAERLRAVVAIVKERVPLYRERLAGVDPASIASVDDVSSLPFTRKSDLHDTYPDGLFAVPREQVARIHASSGTTGKPTIVGYTAADLDVFALVVARCMAVAGAEPGMTLHNAYGYGLFTGGLGLHDGGTRLGLGVVPVSGGITERQVTLITDLRPEVIACTPSYALTLAQAFEERGIPPAEISLRHALLGAEPWTERMRDEIDERLGVRCTNLFGLSEIIGPGVSGECMEARDGLHVQEDHFLAEVVDPETGVPVPEGEQGVLVMTTLTKQALPLLRYWTGDLTALTTEPCVCGRTFARMAAVVGRTDDMLIVRGMNIYPSQVGDVLGSVPELSPHFGLEVRREGTLDELTVVVEPSAGAAADETLARRVEHLLRDTIGCTMAVRVVARGQAPRSDGGKIQRVTDLRVR